MITLSSSAPKVQWRVICAGGGAGGFLGVTQSARQRVPGPVSDSLAAEARPESLGGQTAGSASLKRYLRSNFPGRNAAYCAAAFDRVLLSPSPSGYQAVQAGARRSTHLAKFPAGQLQSTQKRPLLISSVAGQNRFAGPPARQAGLSRRS